MATGITEIISLFAGYLDMHLESARSRLNYEGFGARRHSEDFDPRGGHATSQVPPLDNFDTEGRKVEVTSEAPRDIVYGFVKGEADLPALEGSPSPISNAEPPNIHGGGGAPASGGFTLVAGNVAGNIEAPHISIAYEGGGDQKVLQASQQNLLIDNDRLAPEGSPIDQLQTHNIEETLTELAEQASSELPPELMLESYDSPSLVSFASERDTEWKASGETIKGDILSGIYVNGELLMDATALPVFPRSFEEEESPQELKSPTYDPAQIATLGSNYAQNTAIIVDINHAVGTLVVVGDYFRLEAIVQVNLYLDNDRIDYAGAGAFDVAGGENQSFNVASFIETDPDVPSFAGSTIFAGLDWQVDVFEGDLYDIQTIQQSNWIHDNDITLQTTYESNYQLLAGFNEQGNYASFVSVGGDYDLVIVLGDYHEINFIYQKNVLLDPDTLKVLGSEPLNAEGGASAASLTAGANWLQNDASIEQFGTSAAHELTPQWQEIIEQFNNETGELDVTHAFGIPNFGAEALNILVITGSVYDINVIAQENVVADADVGIQTLADASSSDPTVIQDLSTGENALGNVASIVHTGPAADYYIGGDMYEDEMLIQCDIVVGDNDAITQNDPDALATELIVFTFPTEDAGAAEEALLPPTNDSVHHDLLGNVLT